MNKAISWALLILLLSLSAALGAIACDDSSGVKEPPPDGGPPGSSSGLPDGSPGQDGGDKDCFDDPQTHFEIINACTNAARIEKNPTLNKLLPDGGLPPLD